MAFTMITCEIGEALDNAAYLHRLADLARLAGDETRHLRLYHGAWDVSLAAWRALPPGLTLARPPASAVGSVGSVFQSGMPSEPWPAWREQLATCEHGAFGYRYPLTWSER